MYNRRRTSIPVRRMFVAMAREKYGIEKLSVMFAHKLDWGCVVWKMVNDPRTG